MTEYRKLEFKVPKGTNPDPGWLVMDTGATFTVDFVRRKLSTVVALDKIEYTKAAAEKRGFIFSKEEDPW